MGGQTLLAGSSPVNGHPLARQREGPPGQRVVPRLQLSADHAQGRRPLRQGPSQMLKSARLDEVVEMAAMSRRMTTTSTQAGTPTFLTRKRATKRRKARKRSKLSPMAPRMATTMMTTTLEPHQRAQLQGATPTATPPVRIHQSPQGRVPAVLARPAADRADRLSSWDTCRNTSAANACGNADLESVMAPTRAWAGGRDASSSGQRRGTAVSSARKCGGYYSPNPRAACSELRE